jgi:hypothetical protein
MGQFSTRVPVVIGEVRIIQIINTAKRNLACVLQWAGVHQFRFYQKQPLHPLHDVNGKEEGSKKSLTLKHTVMKNIVS